MSLLRSGSGWARTSRSCYGSGTQLAALDSDFRDVTFVVLRSPRVEVDVKTEDGTRPIYDTNVTANCTYEQGEYQFGLFKHADERFRSQNLLPDTEYALTAWSPGLMPNRIERVKLPEGTTAQVTLVLRRQSKRPEVGDPAPPFFVKALDGQAISLFDLRGKFVLLHFWHPQWNNAMEEVPHLKAVQKRFGPGNRLAIVEFCLHKDRQEVEKVVKEKELTWSEVIVRDGWMDATVMEYGAGVPNSILIGPDGRVIARDLQGDKIEEAVAKALASE